MSDPTLVLGPALAAWLAADSAVIAAFAANPVIVLDEAPPTNLRMPYLYIAGLDPEDDAAECLDAAQVILQLDVWTRTRPEARALAAAALGALRRIETEAGLSPAFAIAGFRVVTVQPTTTQYLTDPSDGRTVHAVIGATLRVDPV